MDLVVTFIYMTMLTCYQDVWVYVIVRFLSAVFGGYFLAIAAAIADTTRNTGLEATAYGFLGATFGLSVRTYYKVRG